jgi:hypothetical protein
MDIVDSLVSKKKKKTTTIDTGLTDPELHLEHEIIPTP